MKPDSPALNWTVGFEPDSLVQNWTSGKTLVKTWLVVESYQSEIVILHYFYKIKCYNNYFKKYALHKLTTFEKVMASRGQ